MVLTTAAIFFILFEKKISVTTKRNTIYFVQNRNKNNVKFKNSCNFLKYSFFHQNIINFNKFCKKCVL